MRRSRTAHCELRLRLANVFACQFVVGHLVSTFMEYLIEILSVTSQDLPRPRVVVAQDHVQLIACDIIIRHYSDGSRLREECC
jgi:hypothetical protein